MLDGEMAVEHDRFHFRERRVVAVDVAPARLHHRELLLDEIGHGAAQKIGGRNKIRVENRDELSGRRFQSFLQRTGLESFAIVAVDVEDGKAEGAVALDALAGDELRLVGRIVENLNFEAVARVIELRDGLDEALDHVALVVDRELHRDPRPLRDFRRRSGNILAMLEEVVDEDVAMNSVHRQNHHHQEIRQHDGEIEGVGLVKPAKCGVDQMPPIRVERIAAQRNPQRQIVWRRQDVSALLTAGQSRLYGARRRCQRFVSDGSDSNFR